MDGRFSDSLAAIMKCCTTPLAALMLLGYLITRLGESCLQSDINDLAKVGTGYCALAMLTVLVLIIFGLVIKCPQHLTFDKDAHIRHKEIDLSLQGPDPYRSLEVEEAEDEHYVSDFIEESTPDERVRVSNNSKG